MAPANLADFGQPKNDDMLPERFEIKKEVGRGGMGTVFLAFDKQLDIDVAVKVLTTDIKNDEVKRRFTQEAKELASFNHPAVVKCLDFGCHNDNEYIVLEFISGGNMDDWIKTNPEVSAIIECFQLISDGLEYIHQHGIVHRDLKPENVLMTEDFLPRITDLGIARRVEKKSALTQAGTILGTYSYMAPEQILSSKVGPSADIYSLGVCLFEALTGTTPFTSEVAARILHSHLSAEPPLLTEYRDDLPKRLERLVSRMLKKKPEDRPRSAKEVASLLKVCAHDAKHSSNPDAPTVVVEPRPEFGPLPTILSLLEDTGGFSAHLVGPPGSGRSRVLNHLAQHLKARDVETYTVYPEAEPGHALEKLWIYLTPVCDFSDIANFGGNSECASWIRARLEQKSKTVVLLIDDLERQDQTTIEIVRCLSKLTPPPGTAWILARTPAQQIPEGQCQMLEMPTLKRPELLQLYSDMAKNTPNDETLDWLASRSAGNPKTARYLTMAHIASGGGKPPHDVNLWAQAAIEALDADQRMVLEVIALCGEPVAYDLILQATGMSFRALDTLIEPLTAAGFIHLDNPTSEHFRLCHPLQGTYLKENVPARTERRIRERVLRYLADEPVNMESSRQLTALDMKNEAYEMYSRVGEAQLRKSLPGDAIHTLKEAMDCVSDSTTKTLSLKCRYAEALLDLEQFEEATSLIEEVDPNELDSLSQLRRALVMTRLIEKRRSDPRQLLPGFHSLLRDRSKNSTEEGAALSARLSVLFAKLAIRQNDYEEASEHFEFAEELLQDCKDKKLACQTQMEFGRFQIRQHDFTRAEVAARKLIELALAIPSLVFRIEGLIILGESQSRVGAQEGALKSFQQAERIAKAGKLDRYLPLLSRKMAEAEQAEPSPTPLQPAPEPEPKPALMPPAPSSSPPTTAEKSDLVIPEAVSGETVEESSASKPVPVEPAAVPPTPGDPPSGKGKGALIFGAAALLVCVLGFAAYSAFSKKAKVSDNEPPKVFSFSAVETLNPDVLAPLFNIAPLPGFVALDVQPEDALIKIDGKAYRASVIKKGVEISPGSYKLVVYKENFHKLVLEKFEVVAGATTEKVIRLKPSRGDLEVTSVPKDATIWLDGKKFPPPTTGISPGEHDLKLVAEGYVSSETQSIIIKEGETTKVSVVLKLKPKPPPVVVQRPVQIRRPPPRPVYRPRPVPRTPPPTTRPPWE